MKHAEERKIKLIHKEEGVIKGSLTEEELFLIIELDLVEEFCPWKSGCEIKYKWAQWLQHQFGINWSYCCSGVIEQDELWYSLEGLSLLIENYVK